MPSLSPHHQQAEENKRRNKQKAQKSNEQEENPFETEPPQSKHKGGRQDESTPNQGKDCFEHLRMRNSCVPDYSLSHCLDCFLCHNLLKDIHNTKS